MKMTRLCACCGILLSWTVALVSPVAAQAPNATPGVASTRQSASYVPDAFDPTRALTRSDIGSGIGYHAGYQTFGIFQPITLSPDTSLLWISPRGVVTYDGQFVGNVGAGYRYYDPGFDRMWGVGFWYDHDNSGFTTYNQGGISFESLGKYLDFRANAYIPDGSGKHQVMSSALTGDIFATGTALGLLRNNQVETSLRGGDFEVGGALPYIGDWGFRTYAGGYYLEGAARGAAYGAKARVEALITRDVQGQLAVTTDKLFGTNLTAAVTIYLPGSRPTQFFARQPTQSRLYYQQERNYRVAAVRETIQDTIQAINPATGLPYIVLHVDNTAAPGGDGTAERPLNYLPQVTAGNVNIIEVARGDGTSNNMNHGITLLNGQHLAGDGAPFVIQTVQGNFVFPSGGTPGAYPTITNVGGDGVILANNTEVSGFNIANASGNGIAASTVSNFYVHDVNITGSGGAGISLVNTSGLGTIATANLSHNGGAGIQVANAAVSPLFLRINNVNSTFNASGFNVTAFGSSVYAQSVNSTYASNAGDGIAYYGSAAGLGLELTSNNLRDNANGLSANVGAGSVLNVAADNSLIASNRTNGVLISADNSQVNAAANTTAINNNIGNGIQENITNVSDARTTLINSMVSSNQASGVAIMADNSTGLFNTKNNTFINSNAGNGLEIHLTNTAGVPITNFTTLVDSGTSVSYNGASNPLIQGNGILLTATNSTNNFGLLNGSTVYGNGLNGIATTEADNAHINAVIDNSIVAINGSIASNLLTRNGISMIADDSALNLIIRNGSSISNNATGGVNVTALNSSSFGAFVDGSTISNNIAANGLTLSGNGFSYTSNASLGNIAIQNSVLAFNSGDAYRTNLINGSAFSTLVTGNVISDNVFNGIALTSDNSVTTNFTVTGNTISRNGASGIFISEVNNSSFVGDIEGNDISSNGSFGVTATAQNSNLTLTIGGQGNRFDQDQQAAIAVALLDASIGTFAILDNTITRTINRHDSAIYNGDAINVRLSNTLVPAPSTSVLHDSVISGNFIGSSSNSTLGNQGNGLLLTADGNSSVQKLLIGNVHAFPDLTPLTGNTFGNNGLNGISVFRSDNAAIDQIVISNNNILANGRLAAATSFDSDAFLNSGSGINLRTRGGSPTDNGDLTGTPYPGSFTADLRLVDGNDFQVLNNNISSNVHDGVHLQVEGNTLLRADIINNTIIGNGTIAGATTYNNGIEVTENVPPVNANTREVNGNWLSNTIANNTGNGILLAGITGSFGTTDSLNIGQVGNNPVDGRSYGNIIQSNGQDGILVTSFGNQTIANNNISNNGVLNPGGLTGVGLTYTGRGVGVAFENRGTSGAENAVLTNNVISGNSSDGLYMNGNIGANFFNALSVTGYGNTIANNLGRGINVLNQGGSDIYLKLGDDTAAGSNLIATNALGGIYIVNTSSTTQLGHVDGTIALKDDGSVQANPNLVFDMQNNIVRGNGYNSSFSGGGLALFVGTSNAGGSFSTNAAGFGTNSSSMFGGNGVVNARINDNTFSGNTGSDVYIQSFTSTVDPATTSGTWAIGSIPPFIVNPGYQADPLARLNLVFAGNTGSSMLVNNGIADLGYVDAAHPGAYYDNAEGTFKSRTGAPLNPPGPFTSATRRRNATRLAANTFEFSAGPPGSSFLFPGVGDSTFRVELGANNFGFGAFAIDTEPVPPAVDAAGNYLPGAIVGELPYGWNGVIPGTFTFP